MEHSPVSAGLPTKIVRHEPLGFFDLPLEVRCMMYDVLAPDLLPSKDDDDPEWITRWRDYSIDHFYVPKPEAGKCDPTTDSVDRKVQLCGRLMGVSHGMRLEIGSWFYNRIGFHTGKFMSPTSTRFFGSLTAFTKTLLKSLKIYLDPPEVLGARRPTPEERIAMVEPLTNIISSLPNLRYLRINFEGISYKPSTRMVRDVWYYDFSNTAPSGGGETFIHPEVVQPASHH